MSFRRPIAGTRYGPGYLRDGFWQEGDATPLAITGSIQPARAQDLQSLPEGRRQNQTWAVFTSTELRTADEREQTNPDVLVIYGTPCEVVLVMPWQNGVINHFKALVQRQAVRPAAEQGPTGVTDDGVVS